MLEGSIVSFPPMLMYLFRFCSKGQALGLPFRFIDRRIFAWVLAILLALAVGLVGMSSTSHAQTPEGGYDETEAQAIDRMLMCPVCPAESIDQAQVPLAKQMRQRVREMLAAGASRQEVLDYFADRYGTGVLASPPKSGVSLLAWILPVAGLAAALAAVLLVLRAMTGGRDKMDVEATPAESGEGDLEEYLAAVDRSLAIDGEGEKAGEE